MLPVKKYFYFHSSSFFFYVSIHTGDLQAAPKIKDQHKKEAFKSIVL